MKVLKCLIEINDSSRIQFHDLIMRKEGKALIVGRIETDNFITLDEVGGQTIKLLLSGMTIQEVRRNIYENRNKVIDLEDFVSGLFNIGFVQNTIEDRWPENRIREEINAERSWHTMLAIVGILFWFVLVMSATITYALNPNTHISFYNFIWTNNISINLIFNMSIFLMTAMFHEGFHYGSARFFGVPAKIRVSTRLFMLVTQTEMPSLWAIGRSKRVLVLLSGMMFNLAAMSVILLLIAHVFFSFLVLSMLKAIVIILLFSVLSEFIFFTRTDVYYIIANLTRCNNLYSDSINYLKYISSEIHNKIGLTRQIKKKENPLILIPERERGIIRYYTWFMLAGSVIFLLFMAISFLSVTAEMIQIIYYQMLQGFQSGLILSFLEGFIALVIIILPLFLSAYLTIKQRTKEPTLS